MVRGERGVDFAADDVPDNWNFNGSNPCLHHGGNYNQNQNHGPFYVNYNSASNTNSNIGCRLLEADAGHWACRVWLNLLSVVRVPHPFYYAELTAQHLLTMSRQDTAWYTSGRVSPRNHPRRWNGCEATRRILSLMKRVRVYQQILSEDNLRLAIREVNRGHRRNGDHSLNKKVLEIEANMDQYVAELRRFIEDLVSGDAHMHPPLKRRRWDRNADSGKGKWRGINEPLLWPDQYVHHAVLQPMIPHIMRSMDKYCIASVPGRGNSYGVKAIKKWMKGDAAGTRYGAECDIYHCFEELDPPYVIQALKRPRIPSALGYRFGHGYTILRKHNLFRLKQSLHLYYYRRDRNRVISFKRASGLISRLGQLRKCDCQRILERYYQPKTMFDLKKVVRKECRRLWKLYPPYQAA